MPDNEQSEEKNTLAGRLVDDRNVHMPIGDPTVPAIVLPLRGLDVLVKLLNPVELMQFQVEMQKIIDLWFREKTMAIFNEQNQTRE